MKNDINSMFSFLYILIKNDSNRISIISTNAMLLFESLIHRVSFATIKEHVYFLKLFPQKMQKRVAVILIACNMSIFIIVHRCM